MGAEARVAERGHALTDVALTRALNGYVRGRLGNGADGDDLVQETYARLLSFQAAAPVGNVRALCFAIARNLLHDHHRASRRATVELDEELVCPEPTADVVVAYRRAVAIMTTALERMPPLRREVFLRRRLDGFTTAEIAEGLDMSLAAVEKHVVRAFADLRGALARRGFTMAAGA
jgi:RNA polymerase sigma factor (sigma-70 family)